jgi:hypothetical protein
MRSIKFLVIPMILGGAALLYAVSGTGGGGGITCTTAPGATVPDGSVSATAKFTPSNGVVTVLLADTLVDPKSAGQLLSGVSFTFASGLTSGTLGSTSANLRKIASGGSFTDLGPASTGWALDENFNGGFELCVLCTDLGAAGPAHLLIGNPAVSGTYASANGSIAGNKPHNPFTQGISTFLINIPGVTSSDAVTSATFFFGTTEGISVQGSCQ